MSEEENPFWLVGRTTFGTGAQVTITKAFDAPSAIPSPLEAIESARKQARAELRDRFAMAALPVCLERKDQYGPQSIPDAAQHAYAVADAMLKARGDE